MAENKKSFILYCDLIYSVEKLVKKDREDNTNYAGELFLHILEYVNDKEPIPIDFIVDMAFEPIKQQLKRDLQKYDSIRERNKINGQKGGRPKKPTGLNGLPKKPKKADSVNVNVNVNDNVNDNKEKKRVKKFTPPSIQEVKNYCFERKNNIDPENFVNFYESKNWYVGKNKMSNWKAAVITWEKRDKEKSSAKKESKSAVDILREHRERNNGNNNDTEESEFEIVN